jgi:NAD(P)-dependent dehydrogenase (short-subunit alcohol dehydrogenase family)
MPGNVAPRGRERGKPVLVTGAFGLVGSPTVKQLAAQGRQLVATDMETGANFMAAAEQPPGVKVRWADLTDRDDVRMSRNAMPTP